MGNFREIFGTPVTANETFLLPFTDVSSFKWISIHLLSTSFIGTLSFQGANDGVTETPVTLRATDTLQALQNVSTFPATQIWEGPLPFRWFNIECTNYVSGSITGIIELYETPAWTFGGLSGANSSSIGNVGLADASTSTLTNVNGAIVSTQLLAANTSRKGALFWNDSTAILYLAYAGSAATTAYTTQVQAQQLFEMPYPIYNGSIFGIWSAANGAVRITELT